LNLQRGQGRQEAKNLESLKEGVVRSDHRRTSSQGKRWMVKILCGEFVKSREPSDLTEEQGSYKKYSQWV
jgi:hypothetical protein